MIKRLENKEFNTANEILKLQKESYIIEAELMEFDGIPLLRDTVETIQDCMETFYGFYEENELVGIIAYKIEEYTLDIYRVAVRPKHFKKGIASQMIRYIEKKNTEVKRILVSTGLRNEPAILLYLKLGFQKIKEQEVEENIFIVCFEKICSRETSLC